MAVKMHEKKKVRKRNVAADSEKLEKMRSKECVQKPVQMTEGEADEKQSPCKLQGMQKWFAEYRAKRPGLDVLQEQVNNFIADYEEREEEARKTREAAADFDGWTVVTHQKGRKKTTDAASGTVVGGVSAAAVAENASKKKSQVLDNFYKFQKREARRNELAELQLKFQEDKKRIAQMRAARKFRPY